MKRLATLTLTLCSTLLLGGCYTYWDDGGRYDRDHYRWRDYDRYERGYDQDDQETVIIAATIAGTTMGAIAAIVTTITNNDDESRGRFRSR